MRIVVSALICLSLAACATQAVQSPPQAAAQPAATATKTVAAAAKPQCWSGDDGRFFLAGQTTKVSGIDVVCKVTADGKSAAWTSAKH